LEDVDNFKITGQVVGEKDALYKVALHPLTSLDAPSQSGNLLIYPA
jgi:hypothetical protein